MLLRLGVSNFRSIREYAEISLIAAASIKDQSADLLTWEGARQQVLPGIILYGANAAGKSSVHSAMGALKGHVLNSFSKLGATAKIPRRYFALDNSSADEPTRLDCDFIIDDVRYHYGFEFDDHRFLREWLFSFPEGHRRILFNRDVEQDQIDFGKHLRGRNKAIEELTRPNSLFLSAAAQSSHPQLTAIYSFFEDKIVGVGAATNDTVTQNKIGRGADERLIPFLKLADTGISGLKVLEQENNELSERIYKSIRASVMAELSDESPVKISSGRPEKEIFFSHAGEDGRVFELPYQYESRGTRRLSDLVLRAFMALDTGGTLFVDELDASLHTLLSLKLIELFMRRATNPNGAQLIATTHDTNILCAGILRRDQVWFAEKGFAGNTHVFPLTDIQTRNTDNLEKGYLQGRFGAIPFLGQIDDLIRDENGTA